MNSNHSASKSAPTANYKPPRGRAEPIGDEADFGKAGIFLLINTEVLYQLLVSEQDTQTNSEDDEAGNEKEGVHTGFVLPMFRKTLKKASQTAP
ncbi:MAG: hypothetical protein Q9P14_12400 [candidate division KSB1 bacterium]|nr:hypothetical protein [candidate division KSB1 bacterium]MDQ7063861.1 hypothetical protein [candidate division KSB1 bacterium]